MKKRFEIRFELAYVFVLLVAKILKKFKPVQGGHR